MPQDRINPYRNFRFVLNRAGVPVAGISRVSGLARPRPDVTPGQTKYDAVTLSRGVTYDQAFAQWANKVWDYRASEPAHPPTPSQDFRRDFNLAVFDEAGTKVAAYNLHQCWPSEFAAQAELDGIGNALVIESLVLQTSGWERDPTVAGPTEPSFTD